MNTTDDKTPDPATALLPPARLAEIRKAITGHVGSLEKRRMIEDLLAHLDAIQAPAVEDGGEALGRDHYLRLHGAELCASVWPTLPVEVRAKFIAAALDLDAHGYARGVAAGSETTRHLIEQRNLAQRTAEDAHREIGRLAAEREGWTVLIRGHQDENAHLTVELAAERALSEELRAMEAEALASADRWRAASERHEREAAEARAAVFEHSAAETDKRVAAARLDGAREEQEAIVERVRRWAAEGAPGMPEDGDETLVDWIATQIEGRATEGRQGS